MISQLQEAFENNNFAITGEIGPTKGTNVNECLDEAEQYLKGRCTAVNVTDNQSSVMRLGSMAACHMLIDQEIEPVFQMTCRDRNAIALQSDALSAYSLGIRNVLALTGDHQSLGDHPQAAGVFDLDSVTLLQSLRSLEEGVDMTGNKLNGIPKFYKGAVVTPCSTPLELQLIKMEKKIAAGAQFFQTQAVYDVEQFKEFMTEAAKFGVPIMVGQVLLKSVGMARFMNSNVAGIEVPEHLIEELKKDKDATKSGETGARICAEFLKECKDICQGAHLMTLGWERLVPQIIDNAGLGDN